MIKLFLTSNQNNMSTMHFIVDKFKSKIKIHKKIHEIDVYAKS